MKKETEQPHIKDAMEKPIEHSDIPDLGKKDEGTNGEEIISAAQDSSQTTADIIDEASNNLQSGQLEIDQVFLDQVNKKVELAKKQYNLLKGKLRMLEGELSNLDVDLSKSIENAQEFNENEQLGGAYTEAQTQAKDLENLLAELNDLIAANNELLSETYDDNDQRVAQRTRSLIVKLEKIFKDLKDVGLEMAELENDEDNDKKDGTEADDQKETENEKEDEDGSDETDVGAIAEDEEEEQAVLQTTPAYGPSDSASDQTSNFQKDQTNVVNEKTLGIDKDSDPELIKLAKTKIDFEKIGDLKKTISKLLRNKETSEPALKILTFKLDGQEETRGNSWELSSTKKKTEKSWSELSDGLGSVAKIIESQYPNSHIASKFFDKSAMAMLNALHYAPNKNKAPEFMKPDLHEYVKNVVRPLFEAHKKMGGDHRTRNNIYEELLGFTKNGPVTKDAPLGSLDSALFSLKRYTDIGKKEEMTANYGDLSDQ